MYIIWWHKVCFFSNVSNLFWKDRFSTFFRVAPAVVVILYIYWYSVDILHIQVLQEYGALTESIILIKPRLGAWEMMLFKLFITSSFTKTKSNVFKFNSYLYFRSICSSWLFQSKTRNVAPLDTCTCWFNPYKPSVLFVGHQQTVQNQIRRCKTLHLIRFSTVCKQKFLLRFELKWKIPPNNPKIRNGSDHLIRMGKYIRHKWIKEWLYTCQHFSTIISLSGPNMFSSTLINGHEIKIYSQDKGLMAMILKSIFGTRI